MNWIVNRFAYIVLIASIISFFYPHLFTWFKGSLITIGLGIIMLGMGLTLQRDDFRRILRQPRQVLLGVALQYSVMPLTGYTIAQIFDLPLAYATGVILVACCPGGTASNVITFLARADVALSVSMTAVSTIFSILLTPLITTLLVGSRVDVSAMGLFLSTVQVVLLPVLAGVLLREYFSGLARRLLPLAPSAAVIMITMIVASIIGSSQESIRQSGLSLIFAVFTLHAIGFFAGYLFTWLLKKEVLVRRTVSIEVGMQNSGLGVVLARGNFSDPLTAVPSAISSLFHSLLGSFLAAAWSKRSADVTLNVDTPTR